MAIRARDVVLISSLVLCTATIVLAGPGVGAASASACHRYGDTSPAKLARGEARAAIRCLINRARKRHGVRSLDRSRRLGRAAERHTEYMRRHRCFSHQCSGEPSLVPRLQRVNYLTSGLRSWACGENIGDGQRHRATPRATVARWMHSAPHRANILDSTFRDLGVGFVHGSAGNPGGNGGTYTTDFGMRRG